VSRPITSCELTVTRPDADTDFDSLEDALTCNQFLTPPCRGIVFNPVVGKFFLRDGELSPSFTGCVTFLVRDPNSASLSSDFNNSSNATVSGVTTQKRSKGKQDFIDESIPCDFAAWDNEDVASLCQYMNSEWKNIGTYPADVVVSTPSNIPWNFYEPDAENSRSGQCLVLGTQLCPGSAEDDYFLQLMAVIEGEDDTLPNALESQLTILDNVINPSGEKIIRRSVSINKLFVFLAFPITQSILNDLLAQSSEDGEPDTYAANFAYGGIGYTSAVIEVKILEQGQRIRIPIIDDVANESNEASNSSGSGRQVPEVEATVQARFNIIRTFNTALSKALPLIDLTAVDQPGSVAALLSVCRGLVFEAVKTPIWETALSATAGSGGQFELRISRSRARKFINSGQVDHDDSWCIRRHSVKCIQ